ncbi:MAG: hypothetical protein IPH51_06445 [Rubrivivax sp.]|nr:hypothetical protein [Rubrivivax sp.]MBK8529987.1 hypothetical protein [Rubrivivax sp.]
MRTLPIALLLCSLALPAVAAADSGADLTLRADDRSAADRGPLAQAEALQPGLAPATPSGALLQAELRHTQRLPAGLSLHGNVLLAHQRLQGGAGNDGSRVNELDAALDLGPWQLSAGKKVLGWDVGYGFRPNDVVQQETRRTQFGQTPEGRPLLMVEGFSAESTLALVWANPQRWNQRADDQRGARESALAARAYTRLGGLDLHGFARHGRHTGASTGLALSWVAGDALELHASARVFERHDGWTTGPTDRSLQATNPWQQQTLGGGSQWLLGGQWTGGPRLSLLFEAWHDGTALSDAQWRDWGTRNRALATLAQQAAWRGAAAGNLAWQATPFGSASLRRDNVYARMAWQPEDWTLSVDALLTPADRGHIVSAALQWTGDRWRIDAGLRWYGGPAASILAQLPTRRSALLAATLTF